MAPARLRHLPPTAVPISVKDVWRGLTALLDPAASLERFRGAIATLTGSESCFLVSSGRAALTVTLLALKRLADRTHVVIPAYSCPTVVQSILAACLEPVFCDVSPQTLEHGALAGDTLVAAVVAAGLTPERVVLEITERSIARLPAVVREARRLRRLGFGLALDDTGAGNAGLQMLSQVPVDFIKVDRAVVAQASTDTTAEAVLAALVAFAGKTGSRVVAEGIETVDMLEHVRGAGVACAQGYLLGRPAAALTPTSVLPKTLSA